MRIKRLKKISLAVMVACALSTSLIGCGNNNSGDTAASSSHSTEGNGSKSNPFTFSDPVVIKTAYQETEVTYTFTFDEVWGASKVKSEYPDYTINDRIITRGKMTVSASDPDAEIYFSVTPVYITDTMNEWNGQFEVYQQGSLNNYMNTVYDGGTYDFIILASEDGAGSENIKYLKLNYTDESNQQQAAWVSMPDTYVETSNSDNGAQSSGDATDASNSTEKSTESSTDSKKIIEVKKGTDTEISDGDNKFTLHLDDVEFDDEIHSKSDNMYSQYYTDQDGETYVVAKMHIKNTGGDSLSYSVFEDYNKNITIQFNNEYNYYMQQIDPESTVLSQFWVIDPLKTAEVYFAQSVPDEVIKMPYVIQFEVGDTTYQIH